MRMLSASLMLLVLATRAGAETPVAPEDVFSFSDQPPALFAVDQISHDELADVPDAPAPHGVQHGAVPPRKDLWSPIGARRRGGRGPVFCADPDRFYASITVGSQWLDGEISGFNTAGPHRNYDTGNDDGVLYGGALGMYLPGGAMNGRFRFRAEVEGMERQDVSFVTPSFPGPPGPSTFFYNTSVTDIWSVHGNLWLDLALTQRVGLYSGMGLGVAGKDVATNDTVVAGAWGSTGLSYNVGAGFNFYLTDNITLDLGYRYYDLGNVNVPLAVTAGGSPAGNYRVGLDSSEIRLTLRIDLF